MAADVDTRLTGSREIDSVCERFQAALRAGETIDGLESWLSQVAETLRPELKERLKEKNKVTKP